MKKVFVIASLMLFVGAMGTTVYAMNNPETMEVSQNDDDKKKKKKKGEDKACCKDKAATEGKSCSSKDQATTEKKSCTPEEKAEGAKCCASKKAADEKK
jgi:hypothetical protein